MRVTTFYTPNYRGEFEGLHATCSEFGIALHGVERNFEAWHDAVCFKPSHIMTALLGLDDGVELMWTDADSRFRRIPDFRVFENHDFAAAMFRWSKHHAWEMLTGTMFFRNTPEVRYFVQDWVTRTEKWRRADGDTPEQRSLKEVFDSGKYKMRYLDLPKEWVFIEPDFKELYPELRPVISHLQASRRMKNR